ncbi:MAG: BMP family ABC transporter substrate-binding protein, partial [Lachnospiraceae bacterium]|nr:BMP family ABC transporter substrate-binding protein [Lachnospiraceae bacterium]
VAIYTISGDYLTGNDIGGQTLNLGLSENSVGISGQHTLYSEDIYNEAMDLKDQIIAGTLVPPSDLTEYNEFTDTLE